MRFYQYRRRDIISPLMILFVFFLILMIAFSMFLKHLNPLMQESASAIANQYIEKIINQSVIDELTSNQVDYDEIIVLEKNEEGSVTAVKANAVKINQLKSKITSRILEELGKQDEWGLSISLGNIFDNEFFSARGPKIPLKINPVSKVYTNFKSGFSNAGINQTKHEIFIEMNLELAILLPTTKSNTTFSTTIPVAETIIVGNVPSSYTEIAGVTSSPADSALNIIK